MKAHRVELLYEHTPTFIEGAYTAMWCVPAALGHGRGVGRDAGAGAGGAAPARRAGQRHEVLRAAHLQARRARRPGARRRRGCGRVSCPHWPPHQLSCPHWQPRHLSPPHWPPRHLARPHWHAHPGAPPLPGSLHLEHTCWKADYTHVDSSPPQSRTDPWNCEPCRVYQTEMGIV